MVKVGILGAAGYTGGELIRLLINHPEAEIVFLFLYLILIFLCQIVAQEFPCTIRTMNPRSRERQSYREGWKV